jgi:anti-sigma B factor antagonist
MSSVLTTEIQQLHGEHAVVAVGGAMDFESTPVLTELLLGLVEQGRRHLVLEMSQVGFCDSSGLNALVRVLRQAKGRQGSLALVAPTEPVERLLAITAVDSVISQYPSVPLALESSTPTGQP